MLLTKVKTTATALLTIGTLLAAVAVFAQQETAPIPKRPGESEAATSPFPTSPDNSKKTFDRVSSDLDVATEHFVRQIRSTIAALSRESMPDDANGNGKLARHFRDTLNQVESELRNAQENLAGWLGPDPVHQSAAMTGRDNGPNTSPRGEPIDRFSIPRQASGGRPSTPSLDDTAPNCRLADVERKLNEVLRALESLKGR